MVEEFLVEKVPNVAVELVDCTMQGVFRGSRFIHTVLWLQSYAYVLH